VTPVTTRGAPVALVHDGGTAPVVAIERAHVRDAAGPAGRARGGLTGASIALGPGVHAFLGTPEDGTLALVDLVTGARAPVRGRVRVSGQDPARTSFVRARIGALAAEPRLPDASTVRAAVRLAMRARGETGDLFDAVLDPLGLSPLQARDPRSLSFAETRAVELALALSTPAPVLLLLHEPLAEVALPRLELVPRRLREVARSGACVIVTTSSPADARSLADHVVVLHKGLIAREARGGAGLVLTDHITLHAWVRTGDGGEPHTPGARELAAALSLRPEVRAVSWSEQTGEPSRVDIRGDHAESCALAVIESCLVTGVEIEALVEDPPALGDIRATTETLWKMRARPVPAVVAPSPPPAAPPSPSPPDDAPRDASLPPEPRPAPIPEPAPLPEPGSEPGAAP
jgi:ABC-2 type transport system ATP-binding protein